MALRTVCLALAAILLAASGSAAPRPSTSLSSEPFVFLSRDGRARVQVDLFRLAVPENRSAAASGRVELVFVRFAATAKRPGPPLVWLSGGPGDAATDEMRGPLLKLLLAMREHADVIVLDQRGTGLSSPRLDCPGFVDLPLRQAVDRDAVLEEMRRVSRECRAHWAARGVDLSAYNARESADDLEDLRRALGAEKLTLVGGSWGTQVALTAIRRHPGRIARAMLFGTVGPDQTLGLPSTVDAQLAILDRLVRRDPVLSERVPDLLVLMRRLLTRLQKSPVSVRVADPSSGAEETVVVGRADLQFLTRRILGSRDVIERLPALYDAMETGDFAPLARLVLLSRRGRAPAASRFVPSCASGVSSERARRIQRERGDSLLGEALDFPLPELCSAWEVPQLPEEFRAPIVSEVPVLFVSGSLDVHTPAENAEQLLPGFRNGSHVVLEGATHACLPLLSPEKQALFSRFLSGRTVESARLEGIPLRFRLRASEPFDLVAAGGR